MRAADDAVLILRGDDPRATRAVRADAVMRALFGDGTCNAENARSCFAAESCANGQTPPSGVAYAEELLRDNVTYVALRGDRLLGIVAVRPAVWFRPAWLHNLCVTHEARGSGVGAALLRRALREHPHVSLSVAAGRWHERGPWQLQLRQAAQRLVRFYAQHGFRSEACEERQDEECIARSADPHGYVVMARSW